MTLGPFGAHAGDLAPGDLAVLGADWSDFTIERMRPSSDGALDEAFERLWREFGDRGEMERREVIDDRLAWNPRLPIDGHALLYEMIVVQKRGEIVAIRDHTAIVTPAAMAGKPAASIVVHLSHVLVEPSMRGLGLASWMRALPVETARRCLALARAGAQGRGEDLGEGRREGLGEGLGEGLERSLGEAAEPRITLVAEMDHDDGTTPAVVRRLRSYAKAGFRVVDPRLVAYVQPDFRSAAEIDRSSVQSVPLSLVLRRVGRERETSLGGVELRELVAALGVMFAVHVRADHMEDVRAKVANMPAGTEEVALLVPGSDEARREESMQ